MSDDEKKLSSRVRKEDFVFTVEAHGTPWDVYRLTDRDGVRGMVAFRQIEGRWEIGFLQAGEFTPEQVVEALEAALN